MIEAESRPLPSGDQHHADLSGGQGLPAAILRGLSGNCTLAVGESYRRGSDGAVRQLGPIFGRMAGTVQLVNQRRSSDSSWAANCC